MSLFVIDCTSKLLLKSAGGLFMSTVVIFSEMVFSSANRYRSMKYSWQKMHAPLRLPSIVEALMMSSISGTSVSAILYCFDSIFGLKITSMKCYLYVIQWKSNIGIIAAVTFQHQYILHWTQPCHNLDHACSHLLVNQMQEQWEELKN